MPTPLIGAAISGGASLLGGLLNKPKKTVQQPLYTPEQQQLQSAVSGKLQDRLNNPANLDPLQTAAVSGVNRSFDDAQTSLESRLAARGFGNSGKLVTNTKNLAIARAGAQGSLESQFAGLKLDQENNNLRMAGDFGFRAPGSTTTQSTPSPYGPAINSGAETASLLYALNHSMGGGGGGINPNYASNDLGGYAGAGPQLPPQ